MEGIRTGMMPQMRLQRRRSRWILQSSNTEDSQITTVRTVGQLVEAVADGKEFIRVVAHLDLTHGRPGSKDFALNKITSNTRAIRGACDTPPSKEMMANLNLTLPLEVKRGQCLLVSNTAVLTGEDADLLFENFAVPVLPNNNDKKLSNPILKFVDSDVYLSGITIYGDDVRECKDHRCVLHAVGSNVAAEGCAFVNFEAGRIVDVAPGSAVSLQNSDFKGNLEIVSPLILVATQLCGDPEYLDSFLWINDCAFDGSTTIVAFKGAGSQYQLYVDHMEGFSVCEVKVEDDCSDQCLPGQLQDVSSLPVVNPFYTSSDERLQTILQDWDTAMSGRFDAQPPGAVAAVSPVPSSNTSGVDTVAFQGAMSALGVLAIVVLFFIFRACRKKRNKKRLARRSKDREQHQRPAQRPANEATEDGTTVNWEAQGHVSQHVSYHPESATGALPNTASETSSGNNAPYQLEQELACETSPSVSSQSTQTGARQVSQRQPPAPHARHLSPKHCHPQVAPQHPQGHAQASSSRDHAHAVQLPNQSRNVEGPDSEDSPPELPTQNCPTQFSAGDDSGMDSERRAVEVMTAPAGAAYTTDVQLGGSRDSNPAQAIQHFSTEDASTANIFEAIISRVKNGDLFRGRYVINFEKRPDLELAREKGMLAIPCYDEKGRREERLCLMIFKGWIFYNKQMLVWRPSDKRLHAIVQGFVCASYPHHSKQRNKLRKIKIPFWMILKTPDSLADRAQDPGLDKLTALEVACQICEQLSQLHAYGFVNGDLTPDSIRLEDNTSGAKVRAALYSFGYMVREGKLRLIPRLRTTSAPELIRADASKARIKAHPAQDVYGMAVIFGEILTGIHITRWGKQPLSFDEFTQLALDGQRMPWQGELNPVVEKGLAQLKPIILQALHPDPWQRPPAQVLLKCLRTVTREGNLSEELKRTLNVHTATTESHELQGQSTANAAAASTSCAAPTPAVSDALPRRSSEERARAPPQEDQQIPHREPSESRARIRTAAELWDLWMKVRAEQSASAVEKPATVTTSVTRASNKGCEVKPAHEDLHMMHGTTSNHTARAGHAAPSPRATGRSSRDQPADDEYKLLHHGTKKEGRRGSRAQPRAHAVVQQASCSNEVAGAAQVHDGEMSSTATDTHGTLQHTRGSASSASASQTCTAATTRSSDVPSAPDSATMQAIQPSSAAWYSRSPAGGSFLSSVGSVQPLPARKMITAAYRFANSLLSGSRGGAHPLKSTDVISPPVSQVRANDRSIPNVLGSSS